MKNLVIYKITNSKNGKNYIGATNNLKGRLAFHKHNQISSCGTRLGDAIFQDGWSTFYTEVIEAVETKEELKFLERKYIAEYNSNDPEFGYNSNHGGGGTVKGTPKGEIHKQHIALALEGKPKSEEHKAKMSAARIGRKFPRG